MRVIQRRLRGPNRSKSADVFGAAIAEHMEVVRQVEAQQPVLEAIARAMTATLRAGGKILWCGNGGSAGDSQHLAAELVGRYRRERRGMASVLPAAATNSGEGISPAARAMANGSPPGRDAATARADAGRLSGSESRQRRMARSTAGSMSTAIDVMLVRWPDSC